jgi:uncharacterized membrane protein
LDVERLLGVSFVNYLLFASTFFATLGCGLMAGLFFTFSNFVMKALGTLPPTKGIAAMQSINVVVLNPLFLGIFLGTAVACVLLVIFAFGRWNDPGAVWLLAGGVLYLVGTFVVTIVFNVPLNDALAAVNPESADNVNVWQHYLSRWTAWNHVRTISALAATASLTVALCHLRRLLDSAPGLT